MRFATTTETLGRHHRALLAIVGLVGLAAALAFDPAATAAASRQNWPPFVLVAGLLLVGLVSERDGLFLAAGQWLAARARSGLLLYVGSVALIWIVTALLNLDTAVAFLTPVLIHMGRSRSADQDALLYACILLANAGSLMLPGSNLTNLIVIGHAHLSGSTFLVRMAPAGAVAVIITATIVWLVSPRDPQPARPGQEHDSRSFSVALAAVLAATALILALPDPALPVAGVGVLATILRLRPSAATARAASEAVGLPVLIGLFGIAVGLGTVGRAWTGPSQLLTQLGPWTTAGFAAGASVLLNNLPAASLLSARAVPHPYSLLVGLNLGPNLFVTGSLAWVLWWRAARGAGGSPSIRRATQLGLLCAPVSLLAAMALLTLSGYR